MLAVVPEICSMVFAPCLGIGAQETLSVSVNEIIQEILHSLQSEFKKHGVAVHTDLRTPLPDIKGYRSQLQEVMTNLFINANEAMSSIARQDRLLCVQTRFDDPVWTISVRVDDSGAGRRCR